MNAIPADFDPMLELARARMAVVSDHRPWIGENHAACPFCHAREQVHALGLAQARYGRAPAEIDEWENEELPGLANRVAAQLTEKLDRERP